MICFFGKQPDVKKFWRNQLLFTLNKEARILIELDFKLLQVRVYIQKLMDSSTTEDYTASWLGRLTP